LPAAAVSLVMFEGTALQRVKARSVPPRLRAQAIIVSRMPQAATGAIRSPFGLRPTGIKLYDRLKWPGATRRLNAAYMSALLIKLTHDRREASSFPSNAQITSDLAAAE
jgi:hypothetical protein